MKMLFRAALALLVVSAWPAHAQNATSVQAPAGFAPMQAPCVKQVDGTCVPVSAANPMPVTGGAGGGSAPSATNGSAAPATVSPVAGSDGTSARSLRTDNRGGLAPAQAVVTTTRTTLSASTATRISAAGAVAGRIGATVQFETSPGAAVFICVGSQGSACSATNYDFIVPSGAGIGTTYTPLFASTTEVWAYSTGTPTVVFNSWVAP